MNTYNSDKLVTDLKQFYTIDTSSPGGNMATFVKPNGINHFLELIATRLREDTTGEIFLWITCASHGLRQHEVDPVNVSIDPTISINTLMSGILTIITYKEKIPQNPAGHPILVYANNLPHNPPAFVEIRDMLLLGRYTLCRINKTVDDGFNTIHRLVRLGCEVSDHRTTLEFISEHMDQYINETNMTVEDLDYRVLGLDTRVECNSDAFAQLRDDFITESRQKDDIIRQLTEKVSLLSRQVCTIKNEQLETTTKLKNLSNNIELSNRLDTLEEIFAYKYQRLEEDHINHLYQDAIVCMSLIGIGGLLGAFVWVVC